MLVLGQNRHAKIITGIRIMLVLGQNRRAKIITGIRTMLFIVKIGVQK